MVLKKYTVFCVCTYKYCVSDKSVLFNSTSKDHKLDLVEVISVVFENNSTILRETLEIIIISWPSKTCTLLMNITFWILTQQNKNNFVYGLSTGKLK